MIWIFSQFENFPDVSTRLIIPNHTFLGAGAKIKLQLVVQNIFLYDFFMLRLSLFFGAKIKLKLVHNRFFGFF